MTEFTDCERELNDIDSYQVLSKFFNHPTYHFDVLSGEIRITKKSSMQTLVIAVKADLFDIVDDHSIALTVGIEDCC